MKRPLSLVLLAVAACGDAGGGNNVSFGGAQDIGQFRAMLDNGEIPTAGSLDANGFFNEHFNAPPAADCGKVLCLTPGMAVGYDWLTNAKQATLQLAVTTPVDPSTYQRPPMDLVVVVDTSGSMSKDGRLTKVKVGLHQLVDNLTADDRLAIVEFSTSASHISPFDVELDRPHLHDIVDGLSPDGGTNIYAGLEAGFDELTERSKDHQRRVIFLSDGLATEGITSQDSIIEMATLNVKTGIGLTTVGVGDEFDVQLMRGLAERGAGNYYFLEDATAATEVFSQELDYFMVPLALDVSITASAGAGYSFGNVAGTKLWSGDISGGTMRIPAAFLASRVSQSGEPGRRGGGSMIFINLVPNNNGDGKVGDFVITYRVPATGELETQTITLDYGGANDETIENPYLSTPAMSERYAMYNMFIGLRFATHQGSSCAKAALLSTKRSAQAWNARHEDPDLAADIVLADQYLANLDANGATEVDLSQCNATDPYYAPDDEFTGAYDDYPAGCESVGRPTPGALIIVGLVGLGLRRRRK